MTQRGNDTVAVFNKTKGNSLVAQNVHVARGFWQKFRGLMFRNELGEGEGLLLEKTSAIHMCFMRFPIDVIFLDRDEKVVKVVSGLKPWTLWCGTRGAAGVLELKEGAIRGQVSPGDFLTFKEVEDKLGEIDKDLTSELVMNWNELSTSEKIRIGILAVIFAVLIASFIFYCLKNGIYIDLAPWHPHTYIK